MRDESTGRPPIVVVKGSNPRVPWHRFERTSSVSVRCNYTIPFHSVPPHSTPFHSTPLHSIPFHRHRAAHLELAVRRLLAPPLLVVVVGGRRRGAEGMHRRAAEPLEVRAALRFVLVLDPLRERLRNRRSIPTARTRCVTRAGDPPRPRRRGAAGGREGGGFLQHATTRWAGRNSKGRNISARRRACSDVEQPLAHLRNRERTRIASGRVSHQNASHQDVSHKDACRIGTRVVSGRVASGHVASGRVSHQGACRIRTCRIEKLAAQQQIVTATECRCSPTASAASGAAAAAAAAAPTWRPPSRRRRRRRRRRRLRRRRRRCKPTGSAT